MRLLRISAEFKNRRWGLAPCNQSIASGFGAAEIKSVLSKAVLTVFGRPPLRAAAGSLEVGGCRGAGGGCLSKRI